MPNGWSVTHRSLTIAGTIAMRTIGIAQHLIEILPPIGRNMVRAIADNQPAGPRQIPGSGCQFAGRIVPSHSCESTWRSFKSLSDKDRYVQIIIISRLRGAYRRSPINATPYGQIDCHGGHFDCTAKTISATGSATVAVTFSQRSICCCSTEFCCDLAIDKAVSAAVRASSSSMHGCIGGRKVRPGFGVVGIKVDCVFILIDRL